MVVAFNRKLSDTLLPWVAIGYVTGSALTLALPSSKLSLFIFPFFLAFPLWGLIFSRRLHTSYGPIACIALFFLLGVTLTNNALQGPQIDNHIANLITKSREATVVGTISTMVEYNGEKSRFTVIAEEILLHSLHKQSKKFQPTCGKLQLAIRHDLTGTFQPGMKIMAIATLSPPRNFQTPGAFNYEFYLAEKAIYTTGWIKSSASILGIVGSNSSLWEKVRFAPQRVRQQIAIFLYTHLNKTICGLYQALLIGYRGNIPSQIIEQFKNAGTMHLLAISGLHLGLLGGITALLLTFLGKRSQWLLLHTHVPTMAVCLTLPLLFTYCLIAGANAPVLRAFLMAALALYALLIRRKKNLMHLIAAAALLMLIYKPLALATASFQLSFAAIIAIAAILPKLPLSSSDEKQTEKGSKFSFGKLILSLLIVSCAATIGTLPIMLFHFNQTSLVGPVMNLLLEPLLCLWALPAGLVALLFMQPAPELALLILKIGQAGLWLAVKSTAAIAAFPFSSVWTITPTYYEIALYYVVIALCLQGNFQQKYALKAVGIASMSSLLMLSFTSSFWHPRHSKETRIHYLDIGQGNATLLQLPDGKNILIDGGGAHSTRFNIGRNVIAPFLRKQRIRHLESILISHPDSDHFNGIPFLLRQFSPDTLYINGQEEKDDKPYQRLLSIAQQQDVALIKGTAGTIISTSRQYTLSCLGMRGLLDEHKQWSSNEQSLVFLLRHGSRTFLFPGDIPATAEDILLTRHQTLATDVLLASHHGSITSSSATFIEKTRPQLILVSSGSSKKGLHPHSKHIRQWKKQKIPVLITAADGTITCNTNGKSLQVSTFSGKKIVFQ
ncbi:DNA internalization-related competence protein ComEC/Rec2 [Desulfogranum marinum]|uniref:DNA internalization-related competence protein ComEC/Rec2 n=1 Tax=Desulfogranum marinum TaxID=453220 RepID=UPI0019636AE2|nr:DNA internalization-related competence protein ComEC/Rec2 [Desulfogranum marinum]MBM9512120.1 DNA internalization-related competence protein ComEC/Rec2 [Desulfogranum marinum]